MLFRMEFVLPSCFLLPEDLELEAMATVAKSGRMIFFSLVTQTPTLHLS